MNKIYIITVVLIMLGVSPLCVAEEQESYISCLKESFKGNHNFSASDVRSLCKEISGTQKPIYIWTEKKMIPSNDFTKCYDKEKIELKALGDKKAGEVAKIVCSYDAR